jgi:HK97 family phage major capsid protein
MPTPTIDQKLATMETDLKVFIEKHRGASASIDSRLLAMEQRIVRGGSGGSFGMEKTLGETIIDSENFQLVKRGGRSSGKIAVGSLHKAVTIISPGGQNQPLVPDMRLPGIVPPGLPRLTVRDLLAQNRTQSNLVQFTRETGFSNAAAPQAGEGTTKPQSDLTFELANAAVQTLSHWIAASVQILDDAPALQDYINSRLMYGLKSMEENQFLNGDGTGQNFSGLLHNASVYSGSVGGGLTTIDILASAVEQVGASGFEADGICLPLSAAWNVFTTKTTIGSYILPDVQTAPTPRIWGLPIVVSFNLAPDQFLVGAFKQGAALWDRTDATIEISREHSDFFIKNLVAILCEERLALTVFRGNAFVKGHFATGS